MHLVLDRVVEHGIDRHGDNMVLSHVEAFAHQFCRCRRPVGVGHVDGTVNDKLWLVGYGVIGGQGNRRRIFGLVFKCRSPTAQWLNCDVRGVVRHTQMDVLDREHRCPDLVDMITVWERVPYERLVPDSDVLVGAGQKVEVDGIPDLGH